MRDRAERPARNARRMGAEAVDVADIADGGRWALRDGSHPPVSAVISVWLSSPWC